MHTDTKTERGATFCQGNGALITAWSGDWYTTDTAPQENGTSGGDGAGIARSVRWHHCKAPAMVTIDTYDVDRATRDMLETCPAPYGMTGDYVTDRDGQPAPRWTTEEQTEFAAWWPEDLAADQPGWCDYAYSDNPAGEHVTETEAANAVEVAARAWLSPRIFGRALSHWDGNPDTFTH